MNSVLNGLKTVILECPYDVLDDARVQAIFSRLMALKIQGYREVYPYGVLPVDSYDFIATHHLICRSEGDDLFPIMGFKTITLERCHLHRLPFPGIVVLGSSGASEHVGALQDCLQQAESQGKTVSYGSSWTIDPKVRENPELKKVLKDLMGAMVVHWETEIGSDVRVTCGVPKVHSNLFFETLGYERFQSEGQVLPPFRQNSLLGEEAVLMGCERFSPQAAMLAERFRFFLNHREYFTRERRSDSLQPKRKAA